MEACHLISGLQISTEYDMVLERLGEENRQEGAGGKGGGGKTVGLVFWR